MNFKDFKFFASILFKGYTFSEFSILRKRSYDEYINILNPNQTILYQKGDFKIIEWQDPFTLFVAVFDKHGEFVCIEREVWYEYKFPLLKKRVMLDTKDIFKVNYVD